MGDLALGGQEYTGIESTILCLGHTMYDPATVDAELFVKSLVDPLNSIKRTAFQDFVVNFQQFRVYLAMLGG